jgi:hypothetical protein
VKLREHVHLQSPVDGWVRGGREGQFTRNRPGGKIRPRHDTADLCRAHEMGGIRMSEWYLRKASLRHATDRQA